MVDIRGMPPAATLHHSGSIELLVVWRSRSKGREAVPMRAFHLSLIAQHLLHGQIGFIKCERVIAGHPSHDGKPQIVSSGKLT